MTHSPDMMHVQTILVAEDEGLIALDLQMSLEDEGMRVVGPFATLEDCLAAVEKHTVDLAILDVDLRGKNVFPVAERLQENGVPFVFHTGHGDPIELEQRFPGARVCRKPTSVQNLISHLQN